MQYIAPENVVMPLMLIEDTVANSTTPSAVKITLLPGQSLGAAGSEPCCAPSAPFSCLLQ